MPSVVVAQLGARRHYLVPASLHAGRALNQLFTDLYGDYPLLNKLTRMSPTLSGIAKRAANRKDSSLPRSKVSCFTRFGFEYKIRARMAARKGALTQAWLWGGKRFCELTAASLPSDADCVFAFSSASLELFQAAKSRGMTCILDQATAPKLLEDELVMKQVERYPDWVRTIPQEDRFAVEYSKRQQAEAELADVILCNSQFTKKLVVQAGSSSDDRKCIVLPLGLRKFPRKVTEKESLKNRRLQILFVGDEAIRKGVGDFWAALKKLPQSYFEAKVAGVLDIGDVGFSKLNDVAVILGRLPKKEMEDLYTWADVLVLPSISDTFGLTVLEAMSYGVVVITTTNTGASDVIDSGLDGVVVPPMCPERIQDELNRMIREPDRFVALSQAARTKASKYTIDDYQTGLMNVISIALDRTE